MDTGEAPAEPAAEHAESGSTEALAEASEGDCLQVPDDQSASTPTRRRSLKEATNILKREALKQFLLETGGAEDNEAAALDPSISNDQSQQESADGGDARTDESANTGDVEAEQAATGTSEGGSTAMEGQDRKTEVDGAGNTGAAGTTGDGEEPPIDANKSTAGAGEETDSDSEETPKRKLTDDFFYEEPPMMSLATASESVPVDLVQLYHSFGFECTKRSNLQALDKDNVLFMSGNVVEIFNVHTHQQTYIRSSTGCGIGAIAVHPSHKYFAVAEKGDAPPINIYLWPSLKLFRILRHGTVAAYSHVSFSPARTGVDATAGGGGEEDGSGSQLASVGSSPDYMLTVWDWKTESVILRCKAFAQEVYRVSFSADIAGQLTTSGMGHIRFWKMATTFTGLKLQGEIGRFGRTEISDICGYVELPDGKVVSGAEWGNMLLWDGGLIKVEISMKGKKACHQGMIEEVFLEEGELITAAHDGFVRMWDFETIDTADFDEDNSVFEVEPIAEIKVGPDVKLKTLSKIGDPELPSLWFAQDAAGALWKLDISTLHTRKAPERMATFHSGSVRGLDTCPAAHFACSAASDGSVRVQNYATKLLVCSEKMLSGGTAVVWAPPEKHSLRHIGCMVEVEVLSPKERLCWLVDEKLTTVLLGCADGVVRVMVLSKKSNAQFQWTSQTLAGHCDDVLRQRTLPPAASKLLDVQLTLKQALKPHTKPVTAMTFNQDRTLLATGSEDSTVFLFNVDGGFSAIGYVEMPSAVASLQWKPTAKAVLLACCVDGECAELVAPQKPSLEGAESFCLEDVDVRRFTFTSIKQRLRKEEEDARIAAEEEEKRKAREAATGDDDDDEDGEDKGKDKEEKAEGGGKDEKDDAAQEEEEEVEEIDTSQGKVLFGRYADSVSSPDTFILSVGGYDAGYLYHCTFSDAAEGTPEEPFSASPVPQIEESKDTPLTTGYISGQFFFAGTCGGILRVYEISAGDGEKLTMSFDSHWSLSMHDAAAAVNHVGLSFDGDYLLSVGTDSNFFVYKFNGDKTKLEERISKTAEIELARQRAAKAAPGALEEDVSRVRDIDDPSAYSIEEAKQKAENDRRVRLAEKKKLEARRGVELLRREFRALFGRDESLPGHMRLSKLDFQMDPLIQKEVEDTVQQKIEQIHEEFAWETEKTERQLEKLRKKFKVNIETEHTVLRAFDRKAEVSTYRLLRPDDDVIALAEPTSDSKTSSDKDAQSRGVEAANAQTDGSQPSEATAARSTAPGPSTASGQSGASGGSGERVSGRAVDGATEDQAKAGGTTNAGQARAGDAATRSGDSAASLASSGNLDRALLEAEQRKAERIARQQKWADLEATKPDEFYQDPDDVRMINDAKSHMGDFKLKTASDYRVSEDQRVDANKKQQQLAQIELAIYRYKRDFNRMLLELRDAKLRLIDRASSSFSRLTALQSQLPEDLCIPLPDVPTMDEDEVPEKKLNFTKESLLEFKTTQAARQAAKKAAADADGGGFGGFGGFGGGGGGEGAGESGDGPADDAGKDEESTEAKAMEEEAQVEEERALEASSDSIDGGGEQDTADQEQPTKPAAAGAGLKMVSELELEALEESKMRTIEDRDTALQELLALYVEFNGDVRTLQHRKLHLDNCIKQAELRYIITYEEYQLLKDFETRERALMQRLDTKVREDQDMQTKVACVDERYSEKKVRIEDLQEEEKEHVRCFAELVPESSKHYEYLYRVFKKKIKREAEASVKGDDDDDSDSEEEESDEELSDDEEAAEEEDDFDDTIIPPGCSPDTFKSVQALRKERSKGEELMTEEKKQAETLRKELDTLKKKAKLTDGQVRSATADIEAFQREKQAKINELSTVVVLYMDQIKHGIFKTNTSSFAIQSDLSAGVLFRGEGVPGLKRRIEELQRERVRLRNQQKENRVYHKKLQREKRAMLKRIDDLKAQVDRLMVLKFGRVVDLDKLEMAMVSKNMEELKAKMDALRNKHHADVANFQHIIAQAEDELTLVIRENTRKIGYIRQLCAKERDLGKKLKERCAKDASGSQSADRNDAMLEARRLEELMVVQRQEIQVLNDEIAMLQSKGIAAHAPVGDLPRRPVPESKRSRLRQQVPLGSA